jgi:hypothetical protein
MAIDLLHLDDPDNPGHQGFAPVSGLWTVGEPGAGIASYEVEANDITAQIVISVENIRLRIGLTATPEGNRNTLNLNPDGSMVIGTGLASLAIGVDGSILLIGASGGIEINAAGEVTLPLPGAAGTSGTLWNDAGVVKVAP